MDVAIFPAAGDGILFRYCRRGQRRRGRRWGQNGGRDTDAGGAVCVPGTAACHVGVAGDRRANHCPSDAAIDDGNGAEAVAVDCTSAQRDRARDVTTATRDVIASAETASGGLYSAVLHAVAGVFPCTRFLRCQWGRSRRHGGEQRDGGAVCSTGDWKRGEGHRTTSSGGAGATGSALCQREAHGAVLRREHEFFHGPLTGRSNRRYSGSPLASVRGPVVFTGAVQWRCYVAVTRFMTQGVFRCSFYCRWDLEVILKCMHALKTC